MNIKIAELKLFNEERLYGTLLKDLEKLGYLVIEENKVLKDKYIIVRKEDKE